MNRGGRHHRDAMECKGSRRVAINPPPCGSLQAVSGRSCGGTAAWGSSHPAAAEIDTGRPFAKYVTKPQLRHQLPPDTPLDPLPPPPTLWQLTIRPHLEWGLIPPLLLFIAGA